jgi:hypothetical protein
MPTNKHMVSDPTTHALTEGGKNAGGAPPNPIVIRVKDLADAAPIIAKLKADAPIRSHMSPWSRTALTPGWWMAA